jgi:transposase
MMEQATQIPDDLPACQELLRGVLERLHEMEVQLADLKRQLDETCAPNGELLRSYDCLKEQYEAMKRLWLGPRRERLPEAPGQQHLFDIAGTVAPASGLLNPPPIEEPAEQKRKKGHGRRQIPEHLPRTEVPHDVPAEAKERAGNNFPVFLKYGIKLRPIEHGGARHGCLHTGYRTDDEAAF